jgi:hypothetical protein
MDICKGNKEKDHEYVIVSQFFLPNQPTRYVIMSLITGEEWTRTAQEIYQSNHLNCFKACDIRNIAYTAIMEREQNRPSYAHFSETPCEEKPPEGQVLERLSDAGH